MIVPTLFSCRHIYSKRCAARHQITLMRPAGGYWGGSVVDIGDGRGGSFGGCC